MKQYKNLGGYQNITTNMEEIYKQHIESLKKTIEAQREIISEYEGICKDLLNTLDPIKKLEVKHD